MIFMHPLNSLTLSFQEAILKEGKRAENGKLRQNWPENQWKQV